MNDIVKVSSSASGSRGASRDAAASVEEKFYDEKRVWNAHQVRTSPRPYSVGPNRHDVHSSAQQLSHESTCSTRLHQDLTARRVAPRSRAFVSAGFGCAFVCLLEKPKTKNVLRKSRRGAVPGRETCLPRLNVVNTEFQLRHLIIWSCIVIHVSSESATRRRRERRDEKRSVVAGKKKNASRGGARTSRGRRVPSAVRNGSSRFNQSRSSRRTSRPRLRLRGLNDRERPRTVRQEMSGDGNRASRSAARSGSGRSRKKRQKGGWRTSRGSVGCIVSSVSR